ncbi:30S ribosomal protein S8 [Candidatus Micrarchaeota archaeon]|nr:30S ribosomal protein S8 [Candidatus Micrarchaeota archaeon]MBI5177363.1 30S ribosomal protein S8 [Candidatus Micrarchaeota archaeon]
MDTLSGALNSLKMAEFRGKSQCKISPASKVIREVLLILQSNGYVGEFEFVDDGKGGYFIVNLTGRINDCGVVKPRFAVKKSEWEKYESRFLPARGVGLLIASTPQGITTHGSAKERGAGGRLLCFAY